MHLCVCVCAVYSAASCYLWYIQTDVQGQWGIEQILCATVPGTFMIPDDTLDKQ